MRRNKRMEHSLCLWLWLACLVAAAGEPAPRMEAPRQAAGVALEHCRVVAAESPKERAAIEPLLQALRERSATTAAVAPGDALDGTGLRLRALGERETLILVGNILSNRAMLPFYAAFLDFSDAYHPGGDGYVVRTVLDGPTRGVDAIILGGSSEAGVLKAIRRCREIVAGLKPGQPFPLTLEAELGGALAKTIQGSTGQNDATIAGYLYGLTGNAKFAQNARRYALAPAASTNDYTGHYELEAWLRAWALLNDSGAFSPAEVQAVHQALFNTLPRDQHEYWRARDGRQIGSRHQTMGTSAFLSIVRFLSRRGNPNPAAAALLQRWEKECDAYFANALTTFHDDLEDLTSYHSVQPLANYALETGEAAYLKQPGRLSPLELAIRRACASTDNMGYYCGAGTYEEARPGTLRAGILFGYPLAIAACVNDDARAVWLLRHLRGASVETWGTQSPFGIRCFDAGNAAREQPPTDLLGVMRVPLGEYRYARLPHPLPPIERTFEKLCFRDSFAADGQYLVLQGHRVRAANNIVAQDVNNLIRYTDRGVVWLISNTNRQGNFWRNAVWVSDGETGSPGWACGELVGQATSGGMHLVVSRVGDYNGATWTRSLLWLRGQAFAVLDNVRFDKPGERQVFCTFRSAPPAELRGREWIARNGQAEMHLLNADGPAATLSSRRDGPDGATTPTLLREVRSTQPALAAVNFRNLFYVTTPARSQKFEVKSLGDNALLIRGEGCPILFAVRGAAPRLKIGPFESDGEALVVTAEGAGCVGGTMLSGDPKNAANALRQLWEQTAVAAVAEVPAAGKPAPALWRCAGLPHPHQPILAPVLTASEPPSDGALDELMDNAIPLWSGDVVWDSARNVTLTFDLRRVARVAGIELATELVASRNTIPALDTLKDRPAKVEFSDDAFDKDVRGGPATFRAGFTLEPLHKGTVFAMGRWRLTGLDQRAHYVRLTFPPGKLALREVFIRRADGAEVSFGPSLVADLDGDGRNEAIISTGDGALTVLGHDGAKRWNHEFSGAVTCLKAGELASGRRALLVGTREARLYCFSPEGREQWVTDFTSLGGDAPTPYSITLAPPDASGQCMIVVGIYDYVAFVSADGKLLSHTRANGSHQTLALTAGNEFLFFNPWGELSFFDGAQRTLLARAVPIPSGEGLVLLHWPVAGQKNPTLLVASDTGLSLVRTASGKSDWQRALSPSSCVVAAERQIFVGKRDGWLLALSGNGNTLRKVMIGDEVRSLALPPARPLQLWVATGSDLRVLDEDLRELARFPAVARRLELLDGGTVLALNDDGSVSAISWRR